MSTRSYCPVKILFFQTNLHKIQIKRIFNLWNENCYITFSVLYSLYGNKYSIVCRDLNFLPSSDNLAMYQCVLKIILKYVCFFAVYLPVIAFKVTIRKVLGLCIYLWLLSMWQYVKYLGCVSTCDCFQCDNT